MANETSLDWPPETTLTFTLSPTVDGVSVTDGVAVYVSSSGKVPLDERTSDNSWWSVSGGEVTVTIPANVRTAETRWYRVDVAPSGQPTVVAYGVLRLVDR